MLQHQWSCVVSGHAIFLIWCNFIVLSFRCHVLVQLSYLLKFALQRFWSHSNVFVCIAVAVVLPATNSP